MSKPSRPPMDDVKKAESQKPLPNEQKEGAEPAPDNDPDNAVEGRDRLSENENQPMDPGVSDSSHS